MWILLISMTSLSTGWETKGCWQPYVNLTHAGSTNFSSTHPAQPKITSSKLPHQPSLISHQSFRILLIMIVEISKLYKAISKLHIDLALWNNNKGCCLNCYGLFFGVVFTKTKTAFFQQEPFFECDHEMYQF